MVPSRKLAKIIKNAFLQGVLH